MDALEKVTYAYLEIEDVIIIETVLVVMMKMDVVSSLLLHTFAS